MTLLTATYREKRHFYDAQARQIVSSVAELGRALELDPVALELFLHVGWVPGDHTLFHNVECLPGGATIESRPDGLRVQKQAIRRDESAARMDVAEAARRATDLFDQAVIEGLGRSGTPVVPLSGGLDSRAVLAALLRHRSPRDIVTLTFGVPGSLDYEIGNAVARRAGTRHVELDLRTRDLDCDRLMRTADWTDANTDIVFPAVWTFIHDELGNSDVTYWTGFTGDGIGGSHALPPGGSIESGKRKVIGKVRPLSFFGNDFRVEPHHLDMVSDGSKFAETLSLEESVWFENHVERYTAHHLFMRHMSHENPFMHPDLVSLFLSLPHEMRVAKRVFNPWVLDEYRSLFEGLPTADYGYARFATTTPRLVRTVARSQWTGRRIARRVASRLLPRRLAHPNTTYWPLTRDLRRRGKLDELAREMLNSLARRGLVDRRRLAQRHEAHRRGRSTHTLGLTLLISLEAIARRFLD